MKGLALAFARVNFLAALLLSVLAFTRFPGPFFIFLATAIGLALGVWKCVAHSLDLNRPSQAFLGLILFLGSLWTVWELPMREGPLLPPKPPFIHY